ncbi:hypothetical protein BH11PSE6_BH11PSE6_08600 [soil metagenome]
MATGKVNKRAADARKPAPESAFFSAAAVESAAT